ncbi:MAG TPA: M56 family metallopeptidase [Bryobacteraceae bacterium]|nr:M56 family metallopeptidase [Bryobacteraceae bacterium]
MAPSGFAALLVLAFCVPSYLWLEPEQAIENVGLGCILASFCGIAVWTLAVARGLRAGVRSRRYLRSCQTLGRVAQLEKPVWLVDGATPLLALAGIVHPRLVISSEVVGALSAEQLDAALRHEEAHRISRDNLKRLLILLSPGILPGLGGFGALERGWARFTEWAADDRAVAGSPRRSLSLAAALVRVARLGEARQPAPCMTSLLGDRSDLSARVDRLLRGTPAVENPASRKGLFVGVLALGLTCAAAAVLLPASLSTVHRLLETLVR